MNHTRALCAASKPGWIQIAPCELTQENRKPQSSLFLVVDRVAAHVQWAPELPRPVCQKHRLTNCLECAKPSFKSQKCTAGGQRLVLNMRVTFGDSHTKAKTKHSVKVRSFTEVVRVIYLLLSQTALFMGISWLSSQHIYLTSFLLLSSCKSNVISLVCSEFSGVLATSLATAQISQPNSEKKN